MYVDRWLFIAHSTLDTHCCTARKKTPLNCLNFYKYSMQKPGRETGSLNTSHEAYYDIHQYGLMRYFQTKISQDQKQR